MAKWQQDGVTHRSCLTFIWNQQVAKGTMVKKTYRKIKPLHIKVASVKLKATHPIFSSSIQFCFLPLKKYSSCMCKYFKLSLQVSVKRKQAQTYLQQPLLYLHKRTKQEPGHLWDVLVSEGGQLSKITRNSDDAYDAWEMIHLAETVKEWHCAWHLWDLTQSNMWQTCHCQEIEHTGHTVSRDYK